MLLRLLDYGLVESGGANVTENAQPLPILFFSMQIACAFEIEVTYLLWIVLAVNNCEFCCLLWARLTQSSRNYAYLIHCSY